MFSFGGSKSKSSSNSNSRTYVDRAQAPYLNDVRSRAKNLNSQGMPVEGVAGINPRLNAGLQNQFEGGRRFSDAGLGMMQGGFRMGQDGYSSAKKYANNAIGQGAQEGQ